MFKVYRFSTDDEILIYDVCVEFVSHDIEGLHSVPLFLELTHRFLEGDANGDGEVNIADINTLINIILGSSFSDKCDINKDGEMNIADINVIINIILSN